MYQAGDRVQWFIPEAQTSPFLGWVLTPIYSGGTLTEYAVVADGDVVIRKLATDLTAVEA